MSREVNDADVAGACCVVGERSKEVNCAMLVLEGGSVDFE